MAGLHTLKPAAGARFKRQRVGRGDASKGNFSGRGSKGQKARGSIHPAFEGGQLPLVKKLPAMRGFHNKFRTEYQVVNLSSLSLLDKEGEITPQILLQKRLIRKKNIPVKILANGDFKAKLKIHAHGFSKTARTKIEKAGGECVLIADQPEEKTDKKVEK